MKIQTDTRDGVVIIKPIGKIIGPASSQFKHAIINEIAGITDSPNFLFDFADVSRIDSVGIGALVGSHISIAQRGGQVGIINVSNHIKNTFVITKLITTFKHFNTEDEAIVNLRVGEGDK